MCKKDLGIVICNFNKIDYLKGCLETLYKSNFENLTYEVIVVDNASTDGSSECVKENYSDIILLQNETNTGGSGGFDRGIQFAIEKDYKYVALLDNDILLEENTIINLVEYIRNNPHVGVVGSKICTMDNPDILQELGSFIDFEDKFNVYTPLKSHKDDNTLPDTVVCDYVPACSLITTNEVLKKVGSFNVEHFIYWDDMDWCTRVKIAGWEIHAINSSRVFHKMGAANPTNTFPVYYFERNRILFFLKYLDKFKVKSFTDAFSKWIMTLIFFSNLKGNYATPKSVLLAIDDLYANNMGRQDSSIFEKEPTINIFEKYNFMLNTEVCLILTDQMVINRRIYFYLVEYFGDNLKVCYKKDYEEIAKRNFDMEQLVLEKDFLSTNYEYVFCAMSHILDFDNNTISDENFFYIDQFVNIASIKEIENIKSSYKIYEEIFQNIFKPLIERKFEFIRNRIKESI